MFIYARRLALMGLIGSVLAACGGDGTTQPPAAVATVAITGAPGAPLLVGSNVQLVATVSSATGEVLANRAVEWRTSDAGIARVSTSGLVSGVAAGRATITASSEGRQTEVAFEVAEGGTVSVNGGELVMPTAAGSVLLQVPAGVFSQATTIYMMPAADAPPHARLVAGTALRITPFLSFASTPFRPTLRISFDPARLPSGVTAGSLQLYEMVGAEWVLVGGSTVDTIFHTVTGTLQRLSTFAVIATPVDHVVLGGHSLGGGLVVGQAAQFSARALDASNRELPGFTPQWQSSDPSLATVDGSGKVTGVAPGEVTITATIDGKSAAAALLVLPRPASDWTRAEEWSTARGNVRRDGYVAAVLDPALFSAGWSATPFGSVGIDHVTAGDGAVFVVSQATGGFTVGGVAAFETQPGTRRWQLDLGGSIGGAAYSDGKVFVHFSGSLSNFMGLASSTGSVLHQTIFNSYNVTRSAPIIVGGAVHLAGVAGVHSFNASNGSQLWEAATTQSHFSPAFVDGRIIAYTAGQDSPHVRALDTGTGATVFSIVDPQFTGPAHVEIDPAVGSSGNLIVTNGGRLVSYDLATRTVGWSVAGTFIGSVAVANGHVYAVNGTRVEIRHESDGRLLASWQPPQGVPLAPVVVTDNLFFASTANATYAVDLNTTRHVWGHSEGGVLALSSQGVLLIASNNKLRAIVVK
jgi:outer membrane protein assembly factor BamB